MNNFYIIFLFVFCMLRLYKDQYLKYFYNRNLKEVWLFNHCRKLNLIFYFNMLYTDLVLIIFFVVFFLYHNGEDLNNLSLVLYRIYRLLVNYKLFQSHLAYAF